jgi:GTP pyrophosphokinase
VWSQLSDWLEKKRVADSDYIDNVISLLRGMLDENDIPGKVKGRIKHINSIYRKMVHQNLALDEVPDVIAFRVIVDDVKNCYAMLGLVHAAWKPIHGRFKDYISMPKANMYQSLHTTVVGPGGERIEIQIRTEEMDRMAEHGVASHWLYKEGQRVKSKDVRQFAWLREMLDWQKMESDSREFMRSLKFDLFKEEVYVFTPRGEVKELPEGASPIDFAYLIHTKVGDHCSGAKVNGKLVPLSTKLHNGDTVEIITDANRHPSRDWLRFVKTAKARTRINNYIRTEERSRSIALGREMLEKQGRRMGLNVPKLLKEGGLMPVAEEFSYREVEELLSAVGYARLTPRKVLRKLLPKEEEPARQPEVKAPEPQKSRRESDSVSIKGVDDVLVRFGKCCNPVPGDAIVGYISRGRGVTVHTSDCVNVQAMEPERLISVFWDGTEGKPYPARIHMLCHNEIGGFAKITTLLAEEQVNIDACHMRSNVDGRSELDVTVEVRDVAHLYRTIDRLRHLDAVIEVTRHSSHSE